MMFIILIFFLFPNLLFCQSQDKLQISSELQETKDSHSGSISKCKTTSYQPGKEFPAPKLNLPKEFGDGKEFFPSFQCFNEYGLSDETAFNDLDIHKQLLITKKSNLIFYRKSSCEAGWKSKTKNCVSIVFFQPLDGKYVFSKKYPVEALSGEKVRMIADEDENLYMFTCRQEVLGNKKKSQAHSKRELPAL